MSEKPKTVRLSEQVRVTIPKEIRNRLGWVAGTKLLVEVNEDSIVVRSASAAQPTSLDVLVGITGYQGPHKTLEDMEAGIARGAREAERTPPKIIPHSFGFPPEIDRDRMNQLADDLEIEAFWETYEREKHTR